MTTAEKRADLKAKREPWPDCECHGERMYWIGDKRLIAGGWFMCAPKKRQQVAAVLTRRADRGVCVRCAGTLDTETMCRTCADRYADRMAQPRQRMLHRAAMARYGQKARAEEGFRPTGVGRAAFAAWTKGPGTNGEI